MAKDKLARGNRDKPLGKSGAGRSDFDAGAGNAEPRLGRKSSKVGGHKTKANSRKGSAKKGLKITGKDGMQAAGKSSGSKKGPRGRRKK